MTVTQIIVMIKGFKKKVIIHTPNYFVQKPPDIVFIVFKVKWEWKEGDDEGVDGDLIFNETITTIRIITTYKHTNKHTRS